MPPDTITIVGVGLIGGSIALAAHARRVAKRIIGVGRNAAVLAQARQCGAIDSYTTDLAHGVAGADLTIVCTPVDHIAAMVIEAAKSCRRGAVLTDAGSTKGTITTAVEGQLPAGVNFVGSHPLAGSERTGVEHARSDLFEGRVVVVTPTAVTPPESVEFVEAFWQSLGARVVRLSPAEHDTAVSFTSHLPHAVAAATAGVLPPQWLELAASGFRDTTRVAGGDPALWTAIFLANRPAILTAAAAFASRCDEFRRHLEADDGPALCRWLEEGKQVHDAVGS